MQKTNIEYLTHTWNPIVMRCNPVSAGCANCWHLDRCDMFKNNPKFSKELREIYAGDAPPKLIEHRLEDPLKLKKPAVIGVQFMGDLFHKDVRSDDIGEIFQVIAETNHTYIILTKRIKRLQGFCEYYISKEIELPANLYLGVSVEDQKTADERIPILLQIPAAVRVVSYEPALGPVDFTYCPPRWPLCGTWNSKTDRSNNDKLDWLIAGCESGPKRRPAKIEWFRDVKDQCVEANILFFLKQMETQPPKVSSCETGLPMYYENFKPKIEKMPILDGQTWDQLPENHNRGVRKDD